MAPIYVKNGTIYVKNGTLLREKWHHYVKNGTHLREKWHSSVRTYLREKWHQHHFALGIGNYVKNGTTQLNA